MLPPKALHQPGAHGVAHSDHDDGNRGGRCLGGDARRRPVGGDDIHRATGEIGRGLGEPLGCAVGSAIFECDVLAFEIPELAQPLPESVPHRRVVDDADARNFPLLLRARREWPRGCRTAECSQQFPPSDGDCHTPLPREVRKGNDTMTRACCPLTARHSARGQKFCGGGLQGSTQHFILEGRDGVDAMERGYVRGFDAVAKAPHADVGRYMPAWDGPTPPAFQAPPLETPYLGPFR
jgi:hypothetical protein